MTAWTGNRRAAIVARRTIGRVRGRVRQAATKTAALAYIASITPERRLVAAAESHRFLEELDRKCCKPDALGAAFKATPLYAVDALNGAWK